MSKTKRWLTLLLALIALVLIGLNLTNQRAGNGPTEVQNNDPAYTMQQNITVVYDPTGKLSYKLVAEKAEHYNADQVSWFTQPVATMFNEQTVATWSVQADRAKLTKDRMLYLYGHVEVNSLTNDSQLERIKTDNAQINLVTQDVTSDDEVTLYGVNFTSNGLKMRGNLRSKTAELIDKVKSYYETQPKN
ncbi:LPS export ABC transporter periplasmic protein LptC [Dickeya dadantii]|uniref:LPS export ABC transporter periplasmic protein LptC n=1 Tax=Dickeya dadantii TaxID=204038 RepID=UPI001495CCAC|nr:LPS export ABC transporter periplasmic protein LptC [Dickeya dadantii]NPE55269.1 LPS export ABC transporter periplasmic protein LptC [Dickeya dadantii]NPE65990.1 LPS export ABC transporter periplasmic protein LptC [Dickeya dadantii]